MKSKILVGTEVFDITHISTKCGNPNQLHVAEFTMLSVSNVDNERSRVVVLRTHSSGSLVKASDEILPTMLLPMILADCVLFNSSEGIEVQKRGMTIC